MLVVPVMSSVAPGEEGWSGLLRRSQREGWLLVLLDLGVGADADVRERWVEWLETLDTIAVPNLSSPVPSDELIHRVAVSGAERFRQTGALHVDCFAQAFDAVGSSLNDARTLLDWGAGSGRMTTQLIARFPGLAVTAADPDAEAIQWLGERAPVTAVHSPVRPRLPFGDDRFDRVIGHSVLSHLDEQAQDEWLEELARVLVPGGFAALSINGPIATEWHRQHPLVVLPQAVFDDLAQHGIGFWAGEGWDAEHHGGYHTTFHDVDYVRSHWAQWFDVVAYLEGAAVPTQDIVVLRTRA